MLVEKRDAAERFWNIHYYCNKLQQSYQIISFVHFYEVLLTLKVAVHRQLKIWNTPRTVRTSPIPLQGTQRLVCIPRKYKWLVSGVFHGIPFESIA